MDVDEHACTVDIADFQLHQFFPSHAGGVESEQPHPMHRAVGGVDETFHLLPAQNIRQTNRSFRIRCLLNGPFPFQGLDEEEAQRRKVLANRVGVKFPVDKQVRLVLSDLVRT